MFFRFILFVLLGLFVLFGAHYLIYTSFDSFIGAGTGIFRLFLIFFLGFMPLSFLISSLFAHYYENMFTRSLYFVASFWMGMVVNLFFVSIFLWSIAKIGSAYDINISMRFFALVSYGISIVFSLLSFVNAMNPKVNPIEIKVPNLPDNWKEKKIVQLSDVHLGHIHREKFMRGIVSKVNELDPVAVMITGDLFDGMDGKLEELVAPLNELNSQYGTFYVTGNHETYLGTEKTYAFVEKLKMHTLKDEIVNLDGIDLIGISFPELNEHKDIKRKILSLEGYEKNNPSILLYHIPEKIKEMREIGINLQLAGHTHRGQMFPFGFITKLLFFGHDYGLHTYGDYSLYVSNGVGTWGPPMRSGNAPEIVLITLK